MGTLESFVAQKCFAGSGMTDSLYKFDDVSILPPKFQMN